MVRVYFSTDMETRLSSELRFMYFGAMAAILRGCSPSISSAAGKHMSEAATAVAAANSVIAANAAAIGRCRYDILRKWPLTAH